MTWQLKAMNCLQTHNMDESRKHDAENSKPQDGSHLGLQAKFSLFTWFNKPQANNLV